LQDVDRITLASAPLFAALAPEVLDLLLNLGEEQRFEPGAELFAENTAASHIFVVLEGSVRLTRGVVPYGDEVLAVLGVGEVIGELAFLDGEPRSATARVDARTRVLAIPAAALEDLLLMRQDVAVEILWNLVRVLGRRLRKTNERLILLSRTLPR
jgi:CRP/FNR family transcriptional regulator